MPTNGGEEHVLGENTPLALALSKALGSAIVSECDTRSDCIKSSFINNKCNLYPGCTVMPVPSSQPAAVGA